MNSTTSLKLLFVINPKAGTKRNVDWKSEINQYFSQLTHTIDFFPLTTTSSGNLKKAIQKFGPDRVIAVGGDGTVNLVAEQLIGTSIQLGIIPAGSANGLATELRIPSGLKPALEVVLDGQLKICDVILINEKQFCLHLSDLGMNAQLIKYFKAGKLRGMLGYMRMAMRVLVRKQRMNATIEMRDEELLRSAVMIALANASKYGTGASINPDGDLSDGYFEIIIVRRLGIGEVLKMFLKFQRFNPEKIEVLSAKSVSIETKHSVHFQIDGEYLGKVNSVKARILPSQLNILIPANNKNEQLK